MGMRERARHHGGHLGIHSVVGQGSRFQLDIPLNSTKTGHTQ